MKREIYDAYMAMESRNNKDMYVATKVAIIRYTLNVRSRGKQLVLFSRES